MPKKLYNTAEEAQRAKIQKEKEYYEKHKEQMNERARKWHRDNHELTKQRNLAYYHANKDRLNEQKRLKKQLLKEQNNKQTLIEG